MADHRVCRPWNHDLAQLSNKTSVLTSHDHQYIGYSGVICDVVKRIADRQNNNNRELGSSTRRIAVAYWAYAAHASLFALRPLRSLEEGAALGIGAAARGGSC